MPDAVTSRRSGRDQIKSPAGHRRLNQPQNAAPAAQQPADKHPAPGPAAVQPLKHILSAQHQKVKRWANAAKHNPE